MRILSAGQMRRVDELSTNVYGIPSLLLMENAAAQVVSVLRARRKELDSERIAIVCGKGNNGGDGMAVARQLLLHDIHPDVYLLASSEEISGDARVNFNILRALEPSEPVELPDEKSWHEYLPLADGYDVIIDALLGTGLSRPVAGYLGRVIDEINASDAFICSIDLPSGMIADAASGGAPTVHADLTVTFTAPKIAQILGRDYGLTGELVIVPIGSPAALVEAREHRLHLLSADDVRRLLPPRPAHSHKGDYGHILVVAGSQGKAGAAALAGMAALRGGAGLVTVATPKSSLPVVASFYPQLMTHPLAETARGAVAATAAKPLLKLLSSFDAMVLGPGLGTDDETVEFVQRVIEESELPTVLDADGINAFAAKTELLIGHGNPSVVLTPHPGELSRLLGESTEQLLENRLDVALEFAKLYQKHLVLKGHRSLVAAPDGDVFVNVTGNAGMATAGTGDVLSGLIAALLGRRPGRDATQPPVLARAISAAVYLHGRAGDLARQDMGEESMTAADLLDYLSDAFDELK